MIKRNSFILLMLFIGIAVYLQAQSDKPQKSKDDFKDRLIRREPPTRYFLVGYVGTPRSGGGTAYGILDAHCQTFPSNDSLIKAAERRNDGKIKDIIIISVSELSKQDNEIFWNK